MIPDKVFNKLTNKNLFYEIGFNSLLAESKILYQISYKSVSNRIRNIGGIYKNFLWDCEFINGSLNKMDIKKQ